ncbi:hypothetical protein K7432_015919 [Basidiobolus ranarum]|uniref:Uncharacterized protein n=1 Tax=Basidiobolus ranarum TaxID=34480 RepID=A0ABR2WFH3_9FUNG
MILIERKLVAFLQEPSSTERIDVGIVKKLTGNDSVYIRGLYESGRNISVFAKLVYVVNSTENLAMVEKAIWNRIVIVLFSTTFVESPKYPNKLGIMIHQERLRNNRTFYQQMFYWNVVLENPRHNEPFAFENLFSWINVISVKKARG